jgi:hypothetical protein
MSEIKTPPVKIIIGEDEYDAFGEDHTWGDIARWIVAHGPSDVEEITRILSELAAA